jgi:hypothetical protein
MYVFSDSFVSRISSILSLSDRASGTPLLDPPEGPIKTGWLRARLFVRGADMRAGDTPARSNLSSGTRCDALNRPLLRSGISPLSDVRNQSA